jgi:hypothetical protein
MTVVDRTELEDIQHVIDQHSEVLFTWDYDRSRPALVKLYEKAKTSQWNASTQLDWTTDVDVAQLASESTQANSRFNLLRTDPESPVKSWGDKEWMQFAVEMQTFLLSQFLHGEQGALICTGLITATAPWYDAKLYAATQVMDEARHVEVFGRYIDEKLGGAYPINANLRSLLDKIVEDDRWDITYLGMQIMVEGLALAAFGFMHALTAEPLLKELLRYVMSDEARHVAFGVLSLQEFYAGLDSNEIRERQEFAYQAAVQLKQRFMSPDVWERMGADPTKVVKFVESRNDPGQTVFQTMLFSKIVPNCRKLGILDAGDGWLRRKFEELDIIQFENLVDTTAEYGTLDAVAADSEEAS